MGVRIMNESNQVAEKGHKTGDPPAVYRSRVSEFVEMDYLALYSKNEGQSKAVVESSPSIDDLCQTALDSTSPCERGTIPPELKEETLPLAQAAGWPADLMDLLPLKSSMMPDVADHSTELLHSKSGRSDFFVLGTLTLKSAVEIAMAISSDEAAWENGKRNFYNLLDWLETNGYTEDAAVFQGLLLDGAIPDFILFKFIHKNLKLSFIYGGKLIDIKQLYLCLKQVVIGKATAMERSLVSMLGSGQLLALHNEYLLLSGFEESFMHRLLVFLKGKPPSEQWVYLSALQKPEDYIWPRGSSLEEKELLLPLMVALRTLPLSKDYVLEVKKCCEVPSSVEGLLEDAATYSIGALHLHDLQGRTSSAEFENGFEADLSLSGEQVTTELASVLFLERTPETFMKIEDALKLVETVAAEISGHNRPEAIALLSSISGYFRQLRDRRAEEKEIQFLSEVAAIKRGFDWYEKNFQLFRLLALIAGGLAGWLAVYVFGAATQIKFVTVFLFAIALCVLFSQIRMQLLPRHSYLGNRFDLIGTSINLLPAWIAWGIISRFFPVYPAPLTIFTAAWAAWSPLFGVAYSHLQSTLREELLTLFNNRYSVKGERLS